MTSDSTLEMDRDKFSPDDRGSLYRGFWTFYLPVNMNVIYALHIFVLAVVKATDDVIAELSLVENLGNNVFLCMMIQSVIFLGIESETWEMGTCIKQVSKEVAI